MFCRIRVSFEYSKVSVLENRGHFLDEKVSGKGSLLILENDHTSYLLHLSGGTGTKWKAPKARRVPKNLDRVPVPVIPIQGRTLHRCKKGSVDSEV